MELSLPWGFSLDLAELVWIFIAAVLAFAAGKLVVWRSARRQRQSRRGVSP